MCHIPDEFRNGASVVGFAGGVNEHGATGAAGGEMSWPGKAPGISLGKGRGRGEGTGAEDGEVWLGRVSVHAVNRVGGCVHTGLHTGRLDMAARSGGDWSGVGFPVALEKFLAVRPLER